MNVPAAGEAVDDVDVLVGKALAELLPEHLVRRAQDELHDFDRGMDDAELVDGAFEGGGEEVLVQLHDDRLAAFGGVDAVDVLPDRVVETRELAVLGVQGLLVEGGEHLLDDLRDRVVAGEVVAGEQCVEHRPG